MTDIKICGLTRPRDVERACALGARYLGFNFARQSVRRVSPEAAAELSAAARTGDGAGVRGRVPVPVLKVGVFVDESEKEIRRAIEAGGLDLVQLHRPLLPSDLSSALRPVIAVAHVTRSGDGAPPPELLSGCHAILFDTADDAAAGGTGRTFDWSASAIASRPWPVPVFLAGGLNADNVRAAIADVRPSVVDVASGVESEPGVKDPERLARFFEAVQEADEAHAKTV